MTRDFNGGEPDCILRLSGITKSFGSTEVIKSLDLKIDRGAFITLLGPSGSGKTTLLRMIGGFTAPDSGQIIINGKQYENLPPEKRPTSMMFQSYALFPNLTVFENVAFGLRVRKFPRREIDAKVHEMLELVDITNLKGRYPKQLSGGQRQRVALARSLVIEPDILLLDEPFSALDESLRSTMQLEMRDIQKRTGVTTIAVTHDQDEAMILSDHIALMGNGRIVQYGIPTSLYDFPVDLYAAGFMKVENILNGRIDRVSGTGAVFTMAASSLSIPSSEDDAPGRSVAIGIRSEEIRIEGCSQPETASLGENQLIGRVAEFYLKGENVLLRVQTEIGFLETRTKRKHYNEFRDHPVLVTIPSESVIRLK